MVLFCSLFASGFFRRRCSSLEGGHDEKELTPGEPVVASFGKLEPELSELKEDGGVGLVEAADSELTGILGGCTATAETKIHI